MSKIKVVEQLGPSMRPNGQSLLKAGDYSHSSHKTFAPTDGEGNFFLREDKKFYGPTTSLMTWTLEHTGAVLP